MTTIGEHPGTIKYSSETMDNEYICNQSLKNGGINNDIRTITWFEEAAEAGDMEAMLILGELYYEGEHVEQNLNSSMKWYKKAAENGSSYAMFRVAVFYETGTGIKQDLNEAAHWFLRAADAGNMYAMYEVGCLCIDGRVNDIDQDTGIKYLHKAATSGNECAIRQLGYCYQEGYGVEKDIMKAVDWYRKVGEASTICCIGDVYLSESIKSGENLDKIFMIFQTAAEMGDVLAMVRLASLYINGWGVENNIAVAVNWIRKAAYADDSTIDVLNIYKETGDMERIIEQLSFGFAGASE